VPVSERVRLHRFLDGRFQALDLPVVQERPLSVYVNGEELVTLLCTPSNLEALVLGFLAFEGLIRRPEDIQSLMVEADDGCADVRLHSAILPPRRRIHTSGCGGGITFSLEGHEAEVLRDDIQVAPASLFPLLQALYAEAQGYRASRGIHAAALAEGGELVLVAEDVGRHNAIDKVCGAAMLRGIPTEGKLLLTTGRISSEMLRKGAHMRTPVMVSRTSATTLAVDLARRLNITLIGYVRRNSFFVYSHPTRLVSGDAAPTLPPPGVTPPSDAGTPGPGPS